jgi:hypothetical protein
MWLWVAMISVAVACRMPLMRDAPAAHYPLGQVFAGIVISDRWQDDNWLATWRCQLSGVHLVSDFAKIAEWRGDGAYRWGASG